MTEWLISAMNYNILQILILYEYTRLLLIDPFKSCDTLFLLLIIRFIITFFQLAVDALLDSS